MESFAKKNAFRQNLNGASEQKTYLTKVVKEYLLT